ncbi:MAG TPA: adenylate/guanylate cyclase domain-containing protein [Acidimicrobiia bacterium]|nr:adenylate/guanylate cyclase domain-containing protein [Acidimicrobiia bacterium]
MTEMRYARAGDSHIGYTIVEGDSDLDHTMMFAVGNNYPFELMLDDPIIRRFIDGLAALGRVVLFDRRGIGCSDGIEDWETPLVEQWADDISAVVEDARLEAVTIFADLSGAALVWAARRPEELDRLILWNHASETRSSDTWAEEVISMIYANVAGESDFSSFMSPERFAEPEFRVWSDRAGRAGASPAAARRMLETNFAQAPAVALTQRLSYIACPVLVLVRVSEGVLELVPSEYWRRPAEALPHATLVDLSPGDGFPHFDVDPILAEVAAFVTGEHVPLPPERMLAAVLFTDIVESTAKAQTLGDLAWKRVLDSHDTTVQATVGRQGGTVVKTTGDGIVATLPTASAALTAARDLRAVLADRDLACRFGVHVGEVDRRGNDISGLAVNVAARVMAAAEPGQILASEMATRAAAGQGFRFDTAGARTLKGIDGLWELYELDDA